MKNVVNLSLALLLFVIAGSVSAQDAPNSTGPAPYVYNTVEPSVVFQDLALTSRVFSINATSISASQWRKYFAGTPGTSTTVGPVHAYFLGSGDQCGPTGNQAVYCIQQISPYVLFSVDTTTGAITNVASITGILPGHSAGGVTSLAWDATTNTAFIASTNISQSQIYTLNLTTGVATPVGSPITNAPGIISLVCNPAGSLFAIDLVNDNFWRINKTTGTATLVGALGYNANFGQDADIDPRDGIVYWAAIGTGSAQLRTIDTATGTSTLVGNLTGFGQGLATVVPFGTSGPAPSPQGTFCRNGLNKAISDHQWTYDTINVNLGAGCTVFDVNVRIDTVTHTWDSDLSFYVWKGSVGVRIIDNVGGSGDNFIGTVLNDSATIPIASGTAPFTGTYIPSSPLAPFNSQSVNGSWILGISDTAGGDQGLLKGWCLIITYQCPLGGIKTVEIPNTYKLSQNYPNPFNPSTKISYALPKDGDVKLVVFDILGKEVATLVNGYVTAGTHQVEFDASSFSSGIYFYRMEAGAFTETKRMILVK